MKIQTENKNFVRDTKSKALIASSNAIVKRNLMRKDRERERLIQQLVNRVDVLEKELKYIKAGLINE